MFLLEFLGEKLANYLVQPGKNSAASVATSRSDVIAQTIRKGDVLLVEGNSRFSTAVKYLTQSTWSHSALYVGHILTPDSTNEGVSMLLEADVVAGVSLVPLSKYWASHTRICRPVGLSEEEIDQIIASAVAKIGYQYDLKNVLDLIRYVIRTPPVPSAWRRRMLALGSGDPTRAICSSLIAEAFGTIHYPILPEIVVSESDDPAAQDRYREILHIRHHSLYTPRDFDLSPYFRVVKPTIENGFDPHTLTWFNEEMEGNEKL